MMPRSHIARFDVDLALAELRSAINAAGFQIANGITSFRDELDLLNARALPRLIALHPGLDTLAIEEEISSALVDCSTLHETSAYVSNALQQTPGLFQRGRSPARALTALPAYFPPITEARDHALARQCNAIWRTIRKGARIGAANLEVLRRRAAELPFLDDATPAAKAALTRQLKREVAVKFGFVAGRIPTAPRMAVSGSQGTGKTKTTLQALASIRERLCVRFAVPLLEKAAEAFRDYLSFAGPESLPAILVHGRSAADPTDPARAMCPRHEAAELVSKAGLSVQTTMCGACPLRDECGYRRQEAAIVATEGVGLFFMATAGLFSASPAPPANLLIVDERLAAEDVSRVALVALGAEALPYPGGEKLAAYTEAHITMDAVREALAATDQLAALHGEGITAAHLANAIHLLRPLAEPEPLPTGLDDKQICAALERRVVRTAVAALRLLQAVAAEFSQPRPSLTGITMVDTQGNVGICKLRRLHGIEGAAVLALDGTGNPDLVQHLLGNSLEHVECRVERDARVTSSLGKHYSRQSMTGLDMFGRPMPNKVAAAQKLQAEIAIVVQRLPGSCLVVADRQAEACLIQHFAPDTLTTHYGALRGRNTWENCDSVVVAGPPTISLQSVEEMARCYMSADPAPFTSSLGADWPDGHEYRKRGWPCWSTRMRHMRDGSLQPVEVAIHPDPRVQLVFEQVREAEAVQAIDRIRPIWNHRQVFTLDSLVLDLTYDACLSHRELVAGGSPLERGMADHGILPLGARDLAEKNVFVSVKAAERALENTPKAQIVSKYGTGGI